MILDKLFSTRSRILIFRELVRSKEGLSISDLAEKTKLTKMTISKTIRKLEEDRIVKSKIKGNLKLSYLNDEIRYADDIKDVFKWENSIDEELTKIVAEEISKKYKNALSIILFGSRARKEERIDSDFDIMIIMPEGKKKVKSDVIQGLTISIFLINKDEFKKRLKEKDPLISNVYVEGKVLKGVKNYEKLIQ